MLSGHEIWTLPKVMVVQRLIEILLGLDRGFLTRQGDFTVNFNPHWPWQSVVGAGLWNFVLGLTALALVIWVYRREGRSRPVRITLGVIRALLLAFVIALLNRPVLTLGQSRTEPSVLAVVLDDTVSMSVHDAGDAQSRQTRLEAALNLLSADNQRLLHDLMKVHDVRIFPLDMGAQELATLTGTALLPQEIIDKIKPERQTTQVEKSIRAILDKLQGQHV